MLRLANPLRRYAWGSAWAIPELLGMNPDGRPIAEMWFGAHPLAPSIAYGDRDDGASLAEVIAADPRTQLGQAALSAFGAQLPYLLKVLAVAEPLSLQVHPSLAKARAGFAAEERAGVPLESADRNFKDANHKPELIYALSSFDALCGIREPVDAIEVLKGLAAPLITRLADRLAGDPTGAGMRGAFAALLRNSVGPEDIDQVIQACQARLAAGSQYPLADATVVLLGSRYPRDPGVVASLLLNRVKLEPGQAMFVPPGGVHAYLHGIGVEIMANSDNVLRAGLTEKHIDASALLECMDCSGGQPMLVTPTRVGGATEVFTAPVGEFQLSITTLGSGAASEEVGSDGPRIALCLSGRLELATAASRLDLPRGQSVFLSAAEGPLKVSGGGVLVLANVGPQLRAAG